MHQVPSASPSALHRVSAVFRLRARRTALARALNPYESLDELDAELGGEAPWLGKIADRLTVDGDGRLLIVARGWKQGHDLTREVQAVYAIEGSELRLLRWRERDR
jgi:hypothetical protein